MVPVKNAYLWISFVLFGIANCSTDSTTDREAAGGSAAKGGTASGGSGHEPATPIFPTGGAAHAGAGGEPTPTIAEGGAGGARPVAAHPTYEDECADDLRHIVPEENECPTDEGCPLVRPSEGDSCNAVGGAGPDDTWCNYRLGGCGCGEDGWHCEDLEVPHCVEPPEVQRLCPPDVVDESRKISELNKYERLAWCNWFADPSGAPRPRVQSSEGNEEGLSSQYPGFVAEGLCMLELPTELCLENFNARPNCEATIGDLDDCVETLRASYFDGAVLPPGFQYGWVGNRCQALRAQAGCEGLIVIEDCNELPFK